MQQGSGLGVNSEVIAVIWAADRAENIVEIADAGPPAESLDRLFMSFKNVTELDPIMSLTDWPAA